MTLAEVHAVLHLLVWVIVGLLYVIPTIVAFVRRHPNRWLILAVNLAFGATVFGWIGSLVWAMSAAHRSETGSHGGESGLNLFVNDVVRVQSVEPSMRPSPLANAPDPIADLARLKALLDGGAIDRDEYARLKATILKGL